MDGASANFWSDEWLNDLGLIGHYTLQPIPNHIHVKYVRGFMLDDDGMWDWGSVKSFSLLLLWSNLQPPNSSNPHGGKDSYREIIYDWNVFSLVFLQVFITC